MTLFSPILDGIKVVTAGSVDDGKSTLIGRLLYETNSLKVDQLEHIAEKSRERGLAYTDWSLATDGLLEERAQGITIDVAHLYLNLPTTLGPRRLVLADAPGHFEFTRNMVTATAGADAVLILIDASRAIREQTQRHVFIARLLGVKRIIACVNKMDLVGYDRAAFNTIAQDLNTFVDLPNPYLEHPHRPQLSVIPISALHGVNVSRQTDDMPWYQGGTVIEELRTVTAPAKVEGPVIVEVQKVADDIVFGRLLVGQLSINDALDSGDDGARQVEAMWVNGVAQMAANDGENIALRLSKGAAPARGTLMFGTGAELDREVHTDYVVAWFDENALRVGDSVHVQRGAQSSKAKVTAIHHRLVPPLLFETELTDHLNVNDIGFVSVSLEEPLWSRPFPDGGVLGTAALIHGETFNTSGLALSTGLSSSLGFIKQSAT